MKKIAAVLICTLLVIGLAACAGTPGSGSGQKINTVPVTDIDGNEITKGSAILNFGENSVTVNAAYLIDGVDVTVTSGAYASASGSSDQVVFLVVNGGTLTVTGKPDSYISVSKSGSAAQDGPVGDEYSFHGINSGIVVSGYGSSATIRYAEINTDANGANAVVATNNASVDIGDSRITTTGEAGSRGLHATYGGVIAADSTVITTFGASCAALATDRGSGVISASQMVLETNGAGSPLIYSTGDISVANSIGAANNSQMVVVEGGSKAKTVSCSFSCAGTGNRTGTSESNAESHLVDSAGIFIYQSFSGDAENGVNCFSAYSCSFEVVEPGVPMFFITNIKAEIKLDSNTFSSADASDKMFVAEETDQWGSVGQNGGKAAVSLTNQDVSGTTAFVGSASSSLTFEASDDSPTDISVSVGARK